MNKSDAQIIAEVNGVARIVLAAIGTGFTAPPDHRFYAAEDMRSQKAWRFASDIYEFITGTEVHDALLTVTEDERDILHVGSGGREPYEAIGYLTNSDGPSPNLYPLKPKPKPMRCTICGGLVDLTNAVKPETNAGPGGKQMGQNKEESR